MLNLANENGVLPYQHLQVAAEEGIVDSGKYKIGAESIQPSSIDLRLGEKAFPLRCSFLPDTETVATKVSWYQQGDPVDLREGATLQPNQPYLIPLLESLHLPPYMRAKANPKSSTGRLDVFTRVITDRSYRFDEIDPGYGGGLYLEVVSRTFTILVETGLSLNQLRIMVGQSRIDDPGLLALHESAPLLFYNKRPVASGDFAVGNGLFLSLDLEGENGIVGYKARKNRPVLDLRKQAHYEVEDFWEPVRRERDAPRVILTPEDFYLLLSAESVRVPPGLAAEMTAYDPTSGELRTHYAGFFDPGFGYDAKDRIKGSRAALEVRAHDVPFMVEHRQRVCKLGYEHLIEEPRRLYGDDLGSNYQGQDLTLSKHFNVPRFQKQLRLVR